MVELNSVDLQRWLVLALFSHSIIGLSDRFLCRRPGFDPSNIQMCFSSFVLKEVEKKLHQNLLLSALKKSIKCRKEKKYLAVLPAVIGLN